MNTVWILTREVNGYDQEGEYFEGVFKDKPSFDYLSQLLHTNNRSLINHILNGGGRMNKEDMWYYLREYDIQF